MTFTVVFVAHTNTVSATIARTNRYAFDHGTIHGTRYKILMTNALIWTDTVTVLTTVSANWFADRFIERHVTVIARTMIRCSTRAVVTLVSAYRYATAIRSFRVTVFAGANVGCCAYLIIIARYSADRFTNVRPMDVR